VISKEVLVPVLINIMTREQIERMLSDLFKANAGDACAICYMKTGHYSWCLVPDLEEAAKPVPVYQHTCEKCTYLGVYKRYAPDRNMEETYDLYYCMNSGAPRLYTRYGNDSDDIASSIPFFRSFFNAYPDNPGIEAYKRAKSRGFVVPEIIENEEQSCQ
jgi:hypothetical protein